MSQIHTRPSPSYSQSSYTGCAYVDFSPACLKGGGFTSLPVFERFDVLVNKANSWLASNPQWKVISCESIESQAADRPKPDGSPVDTSASTYIIHTSFVGQYNRSLRLWICSRNPDDVPEPQQIGYLNIVPGCTSPAGMFKNPKFQSFADTLQGFNEMLSQNPVQGRIINMETQNMVFETWDGTVDPDACFWTERQNFRLYFLNIMRLFFETGSETINQIGTVDFVPEKLKAKTFGSDEFESFGQTMEKVNTWITQQPSNLNVCNVQSIEYKLDSSWGKDKLDTMRSLYYESDNMRTHFIRIIRVYWTMEPELTKHVQRPLQISYRTFIPHITVRKVVGSNEYETQVENMKRAQAWCNATGAKVMSCETAKIRLDDMVQDGNPETMFSMNPGDSRTFQSVMFALRLYLDGVYNDPPPEVLPPPPEVQKQECCIIL